MIEQNEIAQHTITLLVENKPGVLARIAVLFARRGYNIASLNVSITDDPTLSRMTIVAMADDFELNQIIKQSEKLVDTIKVVDYTKILTLERELALIKINCPTADRAEILQYADIFRASIIDVSDSTYTIEITGKCDKIDAFLKLVEKFGIIEIVRTGKLAMSRGSFSALDF